MKKKLLALFLLLISIELCFAFSKPGKAESDVDVVTGKVKVYGNEPFTFLGFVTEDNKQYKLKGDDKLLLEIQNAQGRKIEIKGKIEKTEEGSFDELKDGALFVFEWKLVK